MKKAISLLMLITLFSSIASANITLLKDGKSQYEVVIAKNPKPITLAAAKDFILYFEKSTGVKLPLNKSGEINKDKFSIVIGDCPAAKKIGIDSENMIPEEFVIKTVGHNLYIVGKDTDGPDDTDNWYYSPQSGSWFGVSRFLQNYLNIRWFMPGESGEYVPTYNNILIPEINISEKPSMQLRRMTYLWDKSYSKDAVKEVRDWKRRNMEGWSIRWYASHVWRTLMPAGKYFKKHPEWYSLVDGKRIAHIGESHGNQLCTTNPEALNEFARQILRNNKKPLATVSLSPNDGGDHCECDKCRALDVENYPNGKPVLTDRYVRYCNEVVKRVLAKDSSKSFAFYAYSFYDRPPRKTKMHDAVQVMLVQNGTAASYYSPEKRKSFVEEKLMPWSKQVKSLFFYTHPYANGRLNLPDFHYKTIKFLFNDLKQAKIRGAMLNNPDSFESTGLANYLYLKMAWNLNADYDAIYKDALEKCYGVKAVPFVEKYFNLIQSLLVPPKEGVEEDIAFGTTKGIPNILKNYSEKKYKKATELLEKALAENVSKNQKIRIQMLVDNLNYYKVTWKLTAAAQKAIKSKATEAEILDAIKLSKAHFAYVNKMFEEDRYMKTSYSRAAASTKLNFSTKLFETRLKQLKNPIPEVKAFSLDKITKPVIDGNLDDSAWANSEEFLFSTNNKTGEKSKIKTSVRIAYDKENLYLGIFCYEDDMASIKDFCVKADGDVWRDNNLDIFFAPKKRDEYKHLVVNSLGTVLDLSFRNGKEDVKWNVDGEIKTSHKNNGWVVEMALSLKSISNEVPNTDDVWTFNIFRVRPKGNEYLALSPTFGLFAKPENFAKLIFK